MHFNAIHAYQHPADEVFAALTDFEAVKSKYEAMGQSDVRLVRRDQGDDGSVTMVTTRVVPLDMPGFAKKVLSPKQHVTFACARSSRSEGVHQHHRGHRRVQGAADRRQDCRPGVQRHPSSTRARADMDDRAPRILVNRVGTWRGGRAANSPSHE